MRLIKFLPVVIFFVYVYLIFLQIKTSNNNSNYEYGYYHKDVAMVFLGSSDCIYSNRSELSSIIDYLDKEIISFLESKDIGYRKIGISTSYDIDREMKYLQKISNFNEISIGNAWANTSLLRYIYNDHNNYGLLPGRAVTPQIIITIRTYNSISTSHRGIYKEEILISLQGRKIDEIKNIDISKIFKITDLKNEL